MKLVHTIKADGVSRGSGTMVQEHMLSVEWSIISPFADSITDCW